MPFAANLYYFASGTDRLSRPPVILLHGAGGNHLYWPPQIRRLQDQRMFAPDLTGHGKSAGLGHHTIADYTDSLFEFMAELKLGAVVLVGHSMGGAIALDAAVRFPGRVLGLGLLGCGAKLRVAPEILRTTATDATFATAIPLITSLSFAPQARERLEQLAAQRLAETRPPVLHGDFLACDSFDVRNRLSGISAPTLILCGASDKMTPPRYSEFLFQHISGARLEIVPDGGHMLMLEQPDRIADLLGGFLGSIPFRPGK